MPERVPSATTVRRRLSRLRRRADAITARILYGDEPWIDIRIAIENLREDVERHTPDRVWLFEAVYEARWRRLCAQGWARARAEC